MNPTTLTLEALSYIRPSNGASNEATIALASPRQLQRIASDMTSVLQDLYRYVPGVYRRPVGFALPAPTVVSVSVTNGSTTFTTGATLPGACTIVIDGDPVYNTARAEGGTKQLLTPYQGATGTKSATVYGDYIVLGTDVAAVIGNVYDGAGDRITKANNKAALLRGGTVGYPDYGRVLRATGRKPTVGRPNLYFVENATLTGNTTSAASQMWMRFNPMPSAAMVVSFDVKVRAPRLTVTDLGSDIADSTIVLNVPEDAIESLLRPIFLLAWTASPWFKDEEAARAIAKRAEPALKALDAYKAQQESNLTMTPTV